MGKFRGIYEILPRPVRNWIQLHHFIHIGQIKRVHQNRIKQIRYRNKCIMVFVASSLGMWRYEEVLKKFSSDKFFEIYLLIVPYVTFSPEVAEKERLELGNHFRLNGIQFIDTVKDSFDINKWLSEINPDIIFYPQPYNSSFGNSLDTNLNYHRLLCYIPYSLNTIDADWIYNTQFLNTAWKLFYPTNYHLQDARRLAANRGRNVEIVGDPHYDEFQNPEHSDPWKNIGKKKRIIWAPHFAITENSTAILKRPGFLDIADDMLALAKEYSATLQFAFKPHPRLKNSLYKHPDWGKERTNKYFDAWKYGDNTQLEEGSFVDLFINSDGMIHNCGSFTAEYLMTGKPVMFITPDINKTKSNLTLFGKKCLSLHYHGSSLNEIKDFIIQRILEGNDVLASKRKDFISSTFENIDKCVAENVYDSIIRELS